MTGCDIICFESTIKSQPTERQEWHHIMSVIKTCCNYLHIFCFGRPDPNQSNFRKSQKLKVVVVVIVFLLTYLSKCIDIVKIKDYLVHVMNKSVADRELA